MNAIIDANTHKTLFEHHPWSGAITKITHPGDGSSFQYFYDANGYHLKSTIDELNHTTTYKLNPVPSLTPYEIDHPGGGVELFSYNRYGQVTSHTMVGNDSTSASGGKETFTYDTGNRGRLVQSYPPASSSDPNPSAHPTVYAYDGEDHLWTVTDPLGHTTTLTHNDRGQLTVVQNPDADKSQTVYAYNDDGTLKSVTTDLTAATAATTSYSYDDYKRLATVTTPGDSSGEASHVTHFWYDNAGAGVNEYTHTDSNVTRLVTPEVHVRVTDYDNNHRKITSTAGAGTLDAASTTYTYDAGGNLQTMKDPKGNLWNYDYDARDRLIDVDDPISTDRNSLGHTVSYTYDALGNKKSEQRANDQIINYNTYDPMNRLTQMTVFQAPSPVAVTKYTWTKAGKIETMTDPRGNDYTYDYDTQNRLITTTYPTGGGTETRTYDFAGNLATFKNRGGDVQTLTYDTRDRETKYSWSTGLPQTRTLIYDDASRTTACNTGSTFINFLYNNDNTLKSQEEWTSYYGDTANHRTLVYAYDGDGNRKSVGLASVLSLGYDYTARDQVWHVTNIGNGRIYATYGYDKNGNALTRALNNGVSSSFGYDALNRVMSLTHPFDNGTRTIGYGYDEVGNRKSVQRDGGTADNFGYDLNNQVLSFQLNGATSTSTYDESGNRTKVVTEGTTTTYAPVNGLNQYTTVGGAAVSHGNNGNLTGYAGWTYTYDSMSRMTMASGPGGVTANFYYDGLNRQVARTISGSATTFSVWDGWTLYAEYLPGNILRNLPIHGAGDDLIEQSESGLPTTFFYPDGMGSTAYVADSVGNLIEKYTYDLAGTPTVYDPNGVIRASGTLYDVTNLSTGQKWYGPLGLYDQRNRFYFPDLGRFLQPDPIGFGGDANNLYRYCGNNPVNRSDPSGLLDLSSILQSLNGMIPGTPTTQRIIVNGDPLQDFSRGASPLDFAGGAPGEGGPRDGGGPGGFSIRTGVMPTSFLPAPTIASPPLPPSSATSAVFRVNNLPINQNADRSDVTPSQVFVSNYGYPNDPYGDTNTRLRIGASEAYSNMLTSDSLAVSLNLKNQYGLTLGGALLVNGVYLGQYNDTAPEPNTIDVYDPYNQLGTQFGGTLDIITIGTVPHR